jgi:hypothetical protein
MHTILAGCSLLGSGAKTIKPRGDPNLLQANLAQIRNDLCLRQSAGDSTCPEIDIAPGILRQLDIQGNVGEMQPTSGLEYPYDFGKAAFFFGDEVEDTI